MLQALGAYAVYIFFYLFFLIRIFVHLPVWSFSARDQTFWGLKNTDKKLDCCTNVYVCIDCFSFLVSSGCSIIWATNLQTSEVKNVKSLTNTFLTWCSENWRDAIITGSERDTGGSKTIRQWRWADEDKDEKLRWRSRRLCERQRRQLWDVTMWRFSVERPPQSRLYKPRRYFCHTETCCGVSSELEPAAH